jgi:hypothetical protein
VIRIKTFFVLFLGACLSASVVMRAAGREATAGDDLAGAVRYATSAIRQHQKAEGYWLTAYTPAARFEHPRPEMNVYLTSMMVDLLDPCKARLCSTSPSRLER